MLICFLFQWEIYLFAESLWSITCKTCFIRNNYTVFMQVTTVGNIECSEIPFFSQSDEFKENLESALQKPYNTQELHELWTSISKRKPIVRFRHTRQRTISVETQDEGFSYLDYHPGTCYF